MLLAHRSKAALGPGLGHQHLGAPNITGPFLSSPCKPHVSLAARVLQQRPKPPRGVDTPA